MSVLDVALCAALLSNSLQSQVSILFASVVIHVFILSTPLSLFYTGLYVWIFLLACCKWYTHSYGRFASIMKWSAMAVMTISSSSVMFLALGFVLWSPLSPLHASFHSYTLPSTEQYFSRKSSSSKRGIFDLSHIVLNIDINRSQWGNLGLWEHADDTYETACQRLARAVYSRGLDNMHAPRLLDVGFGCGDQLFMLSKDLWSESRGAVSAVGVNISAQQVDVAQQRLQHMVSIPGYKGEYAGLQLLEGSATELTSVVDGSFDCITSIDSAYHFAPRVLFFQQAFELLQPNGRLCLTDLVVPANHCPVCASATSWSQFWFTPCLWHPGTLLKSISSVFSIPTENLLNETQYVDCLQKVGFTDVKVEFIEEKVFTPFNTFVGSLMRTLNGLIAPQKWLKFILTGTALAWVDKHDMLMYAVITATKRKS